MPSKYRNRPTYVDGTRFDSQGEARRWQQLRLLERGGAISDLRRQVPYELHAPDGTKVGKIVVDFDYVDRERGHVSEDFKSPVTAKHRLFLWKAKHFAAEYGRAIEVVQEARA